VCERGLIWHYKNKRQTVAGKKTHVWFMHRSMACWARKTYARSRKPVSSVPAMDRNKHEHGAKKEEWTKSWDPRSTTTPPGVGLRVHEANALVSRPPTHHLVGTGHVGDVQVAGNAFCRRQLLRAVEDRLRQVALVEVGVLEVGVPEVGFGKVELGPVH
jgi:hypothetical protein